MTGAGPPRVAEWLVARSVSFQDREVVLGDLTEEFGDRCDREGAGAARRWYWRQMLASIGPSLRRRLRADESDETAPPGGHPMSSVLQDLQFGWRMARRRPLFTSVALLSLAVGMSAATVVFSLWNAVALRPLPLVNPDELGLVLERRDRGLNHNFSYGDYLDLRSGAQSFVDLTAYSAADATFGRESGAEMIAGELVSGSYFATIGASVRLGRGLTDSDDRADGPPVVVVSEWVWRQLGGTSTVLDERTVLLNRQPFVVVGVTAAPFQGMQVGRAARFWAPLRFQRVLDPSDAGDLLTRPTASWLTLLGRVRPATTFAKAAEDLNRLEAGLPKTPNRARTRRFLVTAGRQGDSMLPELAASPLQLLLAAAGVVLLVACANVAGLLLARSGERERELALRAALGATRGRLTRLLVLEAAILAGGATMVAVIVSAATTQLAVPLLAQWGNTVILDVSPDWRVFAFAAGLSVVATVACGLAPVMATLRRRLTPSLADGGRGASGGRRRAVMRRGLVTAQFALSLALLVIATLLVRTLHNLRTLPTGFDLDHLAVLEVDASAAQYNASRTADYLGAAAARLEAMPGVSAVGFARVLPLDFGGSRTSIEIPGYQATADEDMEINFNRVSPGYFDAMGLRAIDGRLFDATDVSGAPPAAIINETMARRYWKDERAVGRLLRLGADAPLTVVGVVPDVKYRMLREEPGPSFYLPIAQARAGAGAFHVRTSGPPAPMLDTLRRTLGQVDAAVPVTRARTLRQQADLNMTDERLAMTIALALAAAAVLLAAVGLYAMIAHGVAQRRREIGVRLALGAVARDVRRLVLGQGLAIALVGSVVGAGLGVLFARTIRARLFGVGPADVLSIVVAIGVLAGVAVLASWLPAQRAARVDPAEVLRVE